MAFVTGSATSIDDLLTALQTACTANGWTLTAGVLARGDCHVKAAVSGAMLTLQAGIGDDGDGNLVTPSPTTYLRAPITAQPITYPATYFIHAVGDEVFMVVNYAINIYITIGFGQSPVPGLPGTGVWLSGNSQVTYTRFQFTDPPGYNGATAVSAAYGTCGLFATYSNTSGSAAVCHFVHHGLDGADWSASAYAPNESWRPSSKVATASHGAIQLMSMSSPSAWNGESILVPIQPAIGRESGMVSIVADLAHARYVRLDNIEAEQVITLGADRWRAYPWYQRDLDQRDPTYLLTSGTYGLAFRYDGP
jgi:hypothetical protein